MAHTRRTEALSSSATSTSTTTTAAAAAGDGPGEKEKKKNMKTRGGNSKPARRDPAKRKEQNRRAQEKYREKQKRRIEDLERRAGAAGPAPTASASASAPNGLPMNSSFAPAPAATEPPFPDAFADPCFPDFSAPATATSLTSTDLINPAALHTIPSSSSGLISSHGFTFNAFDASSSSISSSAHWLHTFPSADGSHFAAKVFFDCGCSTLHIPLPPSTTVLLPIRPALNPYANTLRLDVWCVLAALLENCLHLGIPKRSFCSDDGVSPFYRPCFHPSSSSSSSSASSNSPLSLSTQAEAAERKAESARIVRSMRSMTSTLKYDLRPTENQIVKHHHPYIDVLPWRDLRENLMRAAEGSGNDGSGCGNGEGSGEGAIDEDEFLHDFFNHATCWGGVAGAGTGSPWDGRSWEVTETFLAKWAGVVGGDDGELARQSRWWRDFRGEGGGDDGRVSEVF